MIKKWSYSRWSQYHDCPSMYEWNYLKGKRKFTTSPAMERGKKIHEKAEGYVNGSLKKFPGELDFFKKEFLALRKEYKKGNGFTEPDISMNADLSKATRETSNWLVAFGDYVFFGDELTCIDYKTGKAYPGHRDQGHAYSTALLCMNPEIDKINVEFWYLDNPDDETNTTLFSYSQSDTKRMLTLWENRINKMYSDKEFKKTPYRWCKSCNRHIKNGGDCSA